MFFRREKTATANRGSEKTPTTDRGSEKVLADVRKPILMIFDFDGILADGGEVVRKVMKSIPTKHYNDPAFDFYNYFEDPKFDKGENEVKLDQAIQSQTLVSGMKDLIETMHRKGATLIVYSDSVDIVIEKFLENQGLRKFFTEVYADEARFNSRDALDIKKSRGFPNFYFDRNWENVVGLTGDSERSHRILFKTYDNSLYLRCNYLKPGDLACIRRGSKLFELLRDDYEKRKSVKATFFKWSSGLEIFIVNVSHLTLFILLFVLFTRTAISCLKC